MELPLDRVKLKEDFIIFCKLARTHLISLCEVHACERLEIVTTSEELGEQRKEEGI